MECLFISYTRVDLKWAEWIAWQLEASGYSTVFQQWDIRPGSNWAIQMKNAAARCDRTLTVLSPDYLTSEYGQAEWAAAFAADPLGKRRKLIPVRIKPVALESLDRTIVYIDLVGLDEEAAKTELLSGVNPDRPKTTTPPPYPLCDMPREPVFPSATAAGATAGGTDSHAIEIEIHPPSTISDRHKEPIRVKVTTHTPGCKVTIRFVQSAFAIGDPQGEGFRFHRNDVGDSISLAFSTEGTHAIELQMLARRRDINDADLRVVVSDESRVLLKDTTYFVNIERSISTYWLLAVAGAVLVTCMLGWWFWGASIPKKLGLLPKDYLEIESNGWSTEFRIKKPPDAWIHENSKIDYLDRETKQTRLNRLIHLTGDPTVVPPANAGVLYMNGVSLAEPLLKLSRSNQDAALYDFEAQFTVHIPKPSRVGWLVHATKGRKFLLGKPVWRGYYFELNPAESGTSYTFSAAACDDVFARRCKPLEQDRQIGGVPAGLDLIKVCMKVTTVERGGTRGIEFSFEPLFSRQGLETWNPGAYPFWDDGRRMEWGGLALAGIEKDCAYQVEKMEIARPGLCRSGH